MRSASRSLIIRLAIVYALTRYNSMSLFYSKWWCKTLGYCFGLSPRPIPTERNQQHREDRAQAADGQRCILPELDRKQPDQRIGVVEHPGAAGKEQVVEVGEER